MPAVTNEELYDLIDDAHYLSGSFTCGAVRKRSIKVRRIWAHDAAQKLELLAQELTKLLPREDHYALIQRKTARNVRVRNAEDALDAMDRAAVLNGEGLP
jgi:hypothetical protein